MSKSGDYIFVLWGERFEEVAATIFVATLREAGLRVKVVGLTPPRISGSHGLMLVPDLTLDQALPLATYTVCLIIPHTPYGLKYLNNDPRLRQFFREVLTGHARLVIAELNKGDLTAVEFLWASTSAHIMAYPVKPEDVVEFVRQLADSLQAEKKNGG